MDQKTVDESTHLTDAELFTLAVPPAGEPEVLPRHLSECQSCSRALLDWKASMRDLAAEDVEAIDRRSPEEWNAAADATMARIRRTARPGRRQRPLRWAVGIAASLLLLALAIPRRGSGPPAIPGTSPASSPGLSAADQEDDRLLRDVNYLAQGDDATGLLGMEDSL
ncbi:MAG TPA: hypothetical protein VGK26_09805 [Thermoanaerobaculia bacterium]|jgi:hypothetical protein